MSARPPSQREPPPDESVLTEKAAISVRPSWVPGVRRACLLVAAGSDAGKIVALEARETVIGRTPTAGLSLNDNGISRRHASIVRRGDDFVIQDLGSSNGTMVNGEPVEEIVLRDGDRIQFGPGTIVTFSFYDADDDQFQSNLLVAAQRDALTGAYNKRYLIESLETEVAYATRAKKPLAVLMLDVDHLKRINAGMGRMAGDVVLAHLARLVSPTLRKEDIFARYGGEEFVVVCRGQDEKAATRVGERLRRLAESAHFEQKNVRFMLTISVGVAELAGDAATPQALLAAATSALSAAKSLGRNQVVSHGRLLSDGIDGMPTLRVPKFKA